MENQKYSTLFVSILAIFITIFVVINSLSKLDNKELVRELLLKNNSEENIINNTSIREILRNNNLDEEMVRNIKKENIEVIVDKYIESIYNNGDLNVIDIESQLLEIAKEYKKENNTKGFLRSDIKKASKEYLDMLNISEIKEQVLIIDVFSSVNYFILIIVIFEIVILLVLTKSVLIPCLSFILSTILVYLISTNDEFNFFNTYIIDYIKDDIHNSFLILFVISIVLGGIYLIKIIKHAMLEKRINAFYN